MKNDIIILMKSTNDEVARKIIQDNIYMSIATATKDGEPWISPVFFGYDENYNLYWASDKDAKHSKLIDENPSVAVVIFNSKAPAGTGDGAYITGKAKYLIEKELKEAIRGNIKRFEKEKSEDKFQGESPLRLYKITPEKFWKLKDVVYVKGQPVDYRVEVDPRNA